MPIETANAGAGDRSPTAHGSAPNGANSPPPARFQSLFHGAGWLLAAVAIAIALEATIMVRAVAVNVDGLMFIDVARQLEQDPLKAMRSNDQHPGYPAMIVAAERTLELFGFSPGPWLWTAATRAASGVCGVLSVIAMWLFARRMFGQQVANLTALPIAVLPLFRMNAADALSDTPHLLFYLLAAWCAAEGFACSRASWWAACGLAGGAAFWVRPEGLEAPLVGGLLLLATLALRGVARAQTARSIAALAGAMAVVVLPYVVLAGKITSKQIPFFKHESVPLFIVTESQEAARIAAKEKAVLAQAAPAQQPALAVADASSSAFSLRVAFGVARRATLTFVKNMAWGFRFAFLPMYLLGNWEMIRRRVPWWTIALPAGMGVLHIAILYWVFFLSGYMDQRHVMVLVALALPFAGLGMMYTAELIHRFVAPRYPQHAALAAVVAVACVAVVPRAMTRMNSDLKPVFTTAQWIHAHARPGDAVISNTPYVSFYGQTPGVRLAPETATIEAAILSGPTDLKYDFAVLDLKIEGYRPQWREQIERDFDEVMRLDDPRGHGPKLLIYRRRAGEGLSSPAGRRAEEPAAQIGSTPGATRQ